MLRNVALRKALISNWIPMAQNQPNQIAAEQPNRNILFYIS